MCWLIIFLSRSAAFVLFCPVFTALSMDRAFSFLFLFFPAGHSLPAECLHRVGRPGSLSPAFRTARTTAPHTNQLRSPLCGVDPKPRSHGWSITTENGTMSFGSTPHWWEWPTAVCAKKHQGGKQHGYLEPILLVFVSARFTFPLPLLSSSSSLSWNPPPQPHVCSEDSFRQSSTFTISFYFHNRSVS